jgi:fucose permease
VPAALVAMMFMVGRYPGGQEDGERKPPAGVRDLAKGRTFWLLAAAMALTAGCESSLLYWIPNFIQHEYSAGATTGAYGLMAFSAAMAVGRFGTGAAVRRVPLGALMIGAAFLGAAATLCAALIVSLNGTLALLALAGLFAACFWPSILSLASERIMAGSATLFALMCVAGIIGFGVGPFVVGALAQHFGLRGGLVFLPVSFLAAGLVMLVVLKRPQAGR